MSLDVWVVNLKRSPERREVMRERLGALNIKYNFFDAIDFDQSDFLEVSKYNGYKKESLYGYGLTKSEVACFASHYYLWRKCSDADKPVLIIEDDVCFDEGFSSLVEDSSSVIGKCNLLRFSAFFEKPYRKISCLNSRFDLVRYLKGPRGTQCYMLSPKGARMLLDKSNEWIMAVDEFLDSSWIHGVPSYAVFPNAAWEDSSCSVIGDRNKKKKIGLTKKTKKEALQGYSRLRAKMFNVICLVKERKLFINSS